MQAIGTTDIRTLPSAGGQDILQNTIGNVSNEKTNVDINTVVSDIQRASHTGLLSLPNKDIPTTKSHITMDKETVTNYIPETPNTDYIRDNQTLHDIQQNNMKNNDTCDYIIDEFGLPIVISIIYFIFQSTKTKNYMYKVIPQLHGSDSIPSTHGYMVISVLFGLSIYAVNRLLYRFKL